jgi:putative membrane protein
MFIEILLIILFGILAGTFTGLIPGIHINLISSLLITLSTTIYFEPIYGLTFITSMAITHTFIDFIPSVFLGCPDTDTELSILPGHKLLKNKKGYEAIHLSNKGSLIAIFITILIAFPSIILIKKIYSITQNLIPIILIATTTLLILSEKNKKNAIKILIITGILGLSINTLNVNQPLLPLLSGLFGTSNIILSLKNKTKIPKQKITKQKINLKKPIISAISSAPLCSFLPGLGSGQAAIIGNTIKKNSKKQFLILTGIINTLVMSFSFISLYTINKTRTGATIAIKEIINPLETKHMLLILTIILITGLISYFITDKLSKIIAKKFHKINYTKINYVTLTIIMMITFLLSKFIGIIILIISTMVGIYSIKNNVRRTNMMGSLIIPTILYYLI